MSVPYMGPDRRRAAGSPDRRVGPAHIPQLYPTTLFAGENTASAVSRVVQTKEDADALKKVGWYDHPDDVKPYVAPKVAHSPAPVPAPAPQHAPPLIPGIPPHAPTA